MRVLVPLPDRDFDVTEVAVPWRKVARVQTPHSPINITQRLRLNGAPEGNRGRTLNLTHDEGP